MIDLMCNGPEQPAAPLRERLTACMRRAGSNRVPSAHAMRQLRLLLASLLLGTACDQVGRENARVGAVPVVAAPRLSPVDLAPPRVERSSTGRVVLVDPPLADAIQKDVLRQSDGVVDILWVIDDSGSMTDERRQLVTNFQRFVTELLALHVDFRMGVTSIVFSDGGRLRGTTKVIDTKTPSPQRAFEENTTFPTSRARWEQGLRMTQLALTSPNTDDGGANAGFVRPGAALAIIVVTNEDDASFGTTDYYARVFSSLKGKGNENLVSFSVIGGTTPNGCTPASEATYYGSLAEPAFRYSEVASMTGGVIGSICDASFEQTLLRIAQALNTLKRAFPLTLAPIAGSVRVTVTDGTAGDVLVPDDLTRGFQYRPDTNSVVFLGTYVPPPGSTVTIEYAFAKE